MSAAVHPIEPPASAKPLPAPPLSAFPKYPAAWYLFGPARELTQRPRTKRLLGRDLVGFRTSSGTCSVLDAQCSHLGADLGCGEIVGESIQCPFHHWRYGVDGACQLIPGQSNIPPFARQRSYPVCERHGYLFFFNGPRAFYPLPFFENESPDDYTAGTMFSFLADTGWLMVAGQGFDRQHFESVHDRKLLQPPEISCPNRFARRNRYRAENIGTAWRDRVLRWIVGRTLTLTVHNWGGTFYTVQASFPRSCSRFIVSFRPLDEGRTHFDVIVFAPRGVASLGLPLRRWFTKGHLIDEASQVRRTEYRPARFIEADADLVDCFRWLASLPQSPADKETPPEFLPPGEKLVRDYEIQQEATKETEA